MLLSFPGELAQKPRPPSAPAGFRTLLLLSEWPHIFLPDLGKMSGCAHRVTTCKACQGCVEASSPRLASLILSKKLHFLNFVCFPISFRLIEQTTNRVVTYPAKCFLPTPSFLRGHGTQAPRAGSGLQSLGLRFHTQKPELSELRFYPKNH